ncbi:tetratricopeptide repeat protein [Gemmata obscuriglobus]|nr:glycosyltransferase family 41 protein [Gemmata obscuriglobus]QEG27855.1 tetratricopeptide repeat protein [Gemmata obscuriglobus]VTS05236.1 tpr repeat-containing protein : Tetratricopeptide TPR_1 repeat-containing protein OS=Isosphaera pallida (strain ATCC 43644 / DSM 9630 / IS1B) GN=Isop_0879 PE=4 SV=1: TPR_11: TPR_11: TPR_1 [Gemmata obscuriglobus UQM 2246]
MTTAADHFRAATAAWAAGDHPEAERLAGQALAVDPGHADAHSLLGLARLQSGDRGAALPHWRAAAALRPDVAAHRYNLAELCRRLNDPVSAEPEFRAAAELAPQWAEAHFGLGNVLGDLGRVSEALAAYDRAVALQPSFARALYNRGNLLREEGRVVPAERDYRAALAADPDLTDARVNLGAALGELHRWSEAERCYREALERRPGDADLEAALAGAVLAQGRTAEAARLMEACEPRAASPALTRMRREALLPPVPDSAAALAAAHVRLRDALRRAAADPPRLDPGRVHQSGAEPPMGLAYHSADPRPALEAFAALYAPQITPLEPLSPKEGIPRVGVVVTHGHEGVYDRCLGRLVERIAARERVAVALVCSRSGANVLRHLRPSFPGEYLVLPAHVHEAAERIRGARFDVLHYWEIGTDATNYFLPYFRPSRVQCATWGWPVTSGNPRVDWYVSGADLEPSGGESHYTERLCRLGSLPTCYERPPAPPAPPAPAARRRTFGVGPDVPVYLCVQNLRKWHPDFDATVAALLAADRRGRLVLVGDEQPAITQALMARLRRALGPNAERVGAIARQERGGYLRLVSHADVVLDTPHYGSGANTVADAVACETPLVTWPGPFQRGRWAGAVLGRAGLNPLVTRSAMQFVETAVRVANDEPFRRELAAGLRAFGAVWFDHPDAAVELEGFWLEQVAR